MFRLLRTFSLAPARLASAAMLALASGLFTPTHASDTEIHCQDGLNPVRAVDAFVEMLDLAALWLRCRARGDRAAWVPSGDDAQALRLRLSQPGAVVAPARTRVQSQSGADLADGPPEARLQDDRRFPARQRSRDPQGQPAVRGALPRPSIFSMRASSPSTAASSRPSMQRPGATPARNSGGASARSTRPSTGTWRGLDRADEVLAKTGMHPVEGADVAR